MTGCWGITLTLNQDKRFELTPTSELQEFLSLMKDDRRTANLDSDILQLIFERVSKRWLSLYLGLLAQSNTVLVAPREAQQRQARRRQAV